MRVLGFMTGTSLDAVDMAVLDTDGHEIQGFGPAGDRKLTDPTRDLLLEATRQALGWVRGSPPPPIFAEAERVVAEEHFAAADEFLRANGLAWGDLDLIAMHGQTVLHERPTVQRVGRTVQLGDGALLARMIGRPVAFDFRTADVAVGGEGAPLAPIYHLARMRASRLAAPAAALNLGGVANITVWTGGEEMVAFDTGPANGMIDLLMQARGAGRYDPGGRNAAAGTVDETILQGLLQHPYFSAPPPKSLDRFDFSLEAVADLSLQDAAATLVAFTAEALRLGFEQVDVQPSVLVACGGGRHNPVLMRAIAERLPFPLEPAEALGWRGDSIEAEACAFLGARCAQGLPISFPSTTGVKQPMTGGRIVQP
ncbi:MAG TPA: anhydro-N-acetylmuramic acid kinase [Phenylobacterium sp.]